jgi:hypothetical protein
MIMLAVLLAATTPNVAPQPAPVASAVPAPAPKKERKICKSDPAFTGSRIEKQLCLTKSEWKRRDEAAASEGASN